MIHRYDKTVRWAPDGRMVLFLRTDEFFEVLVDDHLVDLVPVRRNIDRVARRWMRTHNPIRIPAERPLRPGELPPQAQVSGRAMVIEDARYTLPPTT